MTKQQQAPGQLERVRAFVNTVDLEQGSEEFSSPEALVRWLARRGLLKNEVRATQADLKRAVGLREALRSMLLSHNGGPDPAVQEWETLDSIAARAKVRLRFAGGDTGSKLEPEADGVDGALGRILAGVHAASEDGTWPRLKACRDDACQWAFYDNTKNRSGAWCNMAVCGNRAKARAYRSRRGATESS